MRCHVYLCFILMLTTLSGCGFAPLYGPQNAALQQDLQKIHVAPIKDRIGMQMRAHLQHRLNPMGIPQDFQYRLAITLSFANTDLAYLKDDTASRKQSTVTAKYILKDIKTGKRLTSGTVKGVGNFNIMVNSDYSTLVAEEDARQQGILLAAKALELELAHYFQVQALLRQEAAVSHALVVPEAA